MIRVGVAGWDYPDWEGIVYPSPSPKGFDRLAFLSRFVGAIEINVTFYRQVDPRAAASWVSRTPSDGSFVFTVKLNQVFTHPPPAPARDREGALDLVAEARAYVAGIEPLLKSGRLGAVLMQFPQAFHLGTESLRHVSRLRDLFPGLPLVAEFRHRGWDDERALDALRQRGIGFCNIDQPDLGSTLRPTEHVTAPLAYIRLHGRNASHWFDRDAPSEKAGTGVVRRSARYDYFYSMQELQPWVDRARRMAARAEEVFIIANNHYRGKGPANTLMMKSALLSARVPAPAGLIEAFPDLRESAEAVPTAAAGRPRQGRLF